MQHNRARVYFLFLILFGVGLIASNSGDAEGNDQISRNAVLESTFAFASLTDDVSPGGANSSSPTGLPFHTFNETFAFGPQADLGDGIVDLSIIAPANVQSGDNFNVEIRADEIDSLAGAQFRLEYDPALLIALGDPENPLVEPHPQVGPLFVADEEDDQCVSQFNALKDAQDDPVGKLALAFACNNGRDGENVLLWTVPFQTRIVTTEGGVDTSIRIIDDSEDDALILANDDEPIPGVIEGVSTDGPVSVHIDPVNESEAVTLRLDPDSITTSFNSAFTVDIVVDSGDQPISKVDVSLTFDPALLMVDDSIEPFAGDQIEPIVDNLAPPADGSGNEADNDLGTIVYTAERTEAPFPKGEFPIATIHFIAKDGVTTGTPVDILESSQVQLTIDEITADFDVNPVGAVVEIVAVQRGDCNADTLINVADFTSVALEIFDGDGTDASGAGGGTFTGSPVGCDSNADTQINVADFTCVALLIFGGSCGTQGFLMPTYDNNSTILASFSNPRNEIKSMESPEQSRAPVFLGNSILGAGYYQPTPFMTAYVNESASSQTGSVSLSIDPPTLTANKGHSARLDVLANTNGQEVSAIQAFVGFDSSEVEIQSVVPGTELPQILYNHIDNNAGAVGFASGKLEGPLASGNFVLATITFKSLVGNPSLTVSLSESFPMHSVADTLGTPLTTTLTNGVVDVIPGTAGDCNDDLLINVSDFTSVALEIFDGDGEDSLNATMGTFIGNSVGCDPNKDLRINVSDFTCVAFLIFSGINSCN